MAWLLSVQSLFVEQLGIMTLAGAAKSRGHDVALTVGTDEHILQKVQEFRPDVVGFSVLTGYQERYLQLGQILKQNQTPAPVILFGGPHTSFFPHFIFSR